MTSRAAGLLIALLAVAGSASARQNSYQDNDNEEHNNNQNSNQIVGAPEIDPSSAISGVTLLLGGLAVIRGRRNKS
jgi:hypothetical protein